MGWPGARVRLGLALGCACAAARAADSGKKSGAAWVLLVSDGRRGAMRVGSSGAVGCGVRWVAVLGRMAS